MHFLNALSSACARARKTTRYEAMPLWGPEGTYPGGGTVKRSAPARKSQTKSATAVKPPPKSSTIEIVSADGTRLNAQWWHATAPSPKTVVLLIHGVHQSSFLYRPGGPSQLVRRLNAEAPADVLGLDLRGFGLPFKARYVAAAFDLIGRLKPNFGRFHRPLLVLSGPPPPGTGRGPPGRVGFDMHYAGVASMASAVRAAAVVPVELVEVPDAPHELVFEPDVNASVDRIVRYCADVSAAA